ncbi:uncharacterized protein [Clytia hemisphaerica]|uniref:uncharacterized protein n=1 Tax=Clytia hemisphaerica TaxID=252671 RepID=UPI0034D7342F
MTERVGKKLGFCPPKEKFDDNKKCLQLFRQAQQFELGRNYDKANECYERSLSLRYCYPQNLDGGIYQKGEQLLTDNVAESQESLPCSQISTLSTSSNTNPFYIFSQEVWHKIMVYLQHDKALQSLCEVFSFLSSERRKILSNQFVPKVDHHSGIFTKFPFQNGKFVSENLERCIKVSAVYSMCLLGNEQRNSHYLVNYDRETRNATTAQLKDLLYGVFAEEPVQGTFFKVAQRKANKNPNEDLYHSVDRKFMSTHFDRDDIGIDLKSEIRSHLTIYDKDSDDEEYSDSEESDREGKTDEFTKKDFYNNAKDKPYPIKDFHNRITLDGFDHYYRYCRNKFPPKSADEADYYKSSACLYDCITYPEDQRNELLEKLVPEDHYNYHVTRMNVPTSLEPSCAIFRKLNKPIDDMRGESCVCVFADVGSRLTENCSTHLFNSIVANFSKTKLAVELAADYLNSVYQFSQWIEHFCDDGDFELITYRVNIRQMEEVFSSFNHASCQCMFPNYKVNDYVNLSNYPMLDTIAVVVATNKKDSNEVYIYTEYDGITAL